MRKLLTFAACFSFLTSFAISSGQEDYYSYSYARLSYVKGDVFIQRAEDLGYEEGTVNLPVVEGDKLGTREGRAEIHFGKKNYLRINSYTQIDFIKLPRRGYDNIKLHLLSGSIYLRVSLLEEEKDFEIHTPDASFYVLDEGLYRFNVRENKETELLVYEGIVEAAGEEGSIVVKSEEKVIVSNGNFISDPVNFYAGEEDIFAQWNSSRDALHVQTVSRRYLPEELDEYEEELADNGYWVYERPYGYVWVPHVTHTVWRPYYYGRWVWYPIIGWNWVSYDPWGWCVYHYGRWHWRLGLGWYWIPTRIWGPSWVHWYYGYDYIGWCPLSYYGYPVVIINRTFYGRHYHRHYPLNSRAITVIHKNKLRARRISKVALSQQKVRKLGKISLSAKQPARPAFKRTSLNNKKASEVLSRARIRGINKSYNSRKVISPRSKSTPLKRSSRVSYRNLPEKKGRSVTEKHKKISGSRIDSRNIPGYKSRLPQQRTQTSRRTFSANSKSSSSSIKSYPSRNTRSNSRSRVISSSKQRKSFPSRELKSYSRGSSSSRNIPSRSKVKTYTRSKSASSYFKSSVPSSRKSRSSSATRSVRSRAPKARASVSRQTSRKTYSSSRLRSSSSRSSFSSRSSKISSSRSSSSRSSKSSSSRSRGSRSSSRSSSSRSSSRKKK